jgi:sugar lactone lactonase YvrE
MTWNFELVAGPFSFTEGPAWDGEAVLFTDIPTSRIMRYDPEMGS